mmetsp:Transcript_31185/g.61728  ORF Transcript_31185/g.61728 Transcript_31185/m.61728 type:complete len:231 (-) Transcript_31185:78-770(-)
MGSGHSDRQRGGPRQNMAPHGPEHLDIFPGGPERPRHPLRHDAAAAPLPPLQGQQRAPAAAHGPGHHCSRPPLFFQKAARHEPEPHGTAGAARAPDDAGAPVAGRKRQGAGGEARLVPLAAGHAEGKAGGLRGTRGQVRPPLRPPVPPHRQAVSDQGRGGDRLRSGLRVSGGGGVRQDAGDGARAATAGTAAGRQTRPGATGRRAQRDPEKALQENRRRDAGGLPGQCGV